MAVSVATSEAAGSAPPHNNEAETSVLGAILMGERAFDAIVVDVGLRPEHFYRPRHAAIYRAMVKLKEKSEPEPIDVLTVSEELKRAGELDEVGGTPYVNSLPTLVPAAGHFRRYAKIVKELALLRRLLDATRDIQGEVLSFSGDPGELFERAEAQLYRIRNDETSSELRSIEEVLHEELDKLEEVSRRGVELTGTPTGFNDLDSLTGGLQPGNLIVIAARPSMGKCLAGSSLVYDPRTGERKRLDAVVEAFERGEEVWVAAVGEDLRLRPAKVSDALRSGTQRTLRITTRLGRVLEATPNHPLLTVGGWKTVSALGPGARVAVPRRLPRSGQFHEMPDHELVLLAALIADGHLTQKTPRFCYGEDSPVLAEVEHAVAAFGLRLHASEKSHGTATISAGRGAPSNPVRELCIQHGLWGKHSGDKFVPPAIFALDDEQIARFLAVLYGCDGHVYASDRLRQIGYSTISRRLAYDVQHLLLRLGIVSRVRRLRRPVNDGTPKVARELLITGQQGLATFADRVAVCGKSEHLARVVAGLKSVRPGTNTDTVPVEIWDEVKVTMGERTWRSLSAETGRPDEHNWHVDSRGLSRRLLAEIAGATRDARLDAFANSDVWWDEIAAIEEMGEQETYDLTIPEHHNFVADDVVVHNSALIANIAENAAVDHGKPVALFSLEMSETELAQRFIASQAKLNGDDLRKGRVKADRWPKVLKATEKLAAAPLFIDDTSDLGVLELRAKARRLHSRHELGLVIVDYLQLMRPEDTAENRVVQIGQMSRGLKILARELKVPVIAVSQLSRAVEARPDKRPLLSDLRESGNVEQDSDVVVFIYRDEYYNKENSEYPGEAELIVSKHRNGPVGNVRLAFIPRHPKFANLYKERAGELPVPAGGNGAG